MKRSSREALVKGLNILDDFCTANDLNNAVQNRATEIYRQAAQTDDMLFGRGIEQVAAGCIVLAARETSSLISAEEIADSASDQIQEKTLHRTTKDLRSKLDLGFALQDPHKYLDPIADELNATDHDRELAETIVDMVLDDGIASGKKARTITGTTYYLISVLPIGDGDWTQNDISKAADITEVTIRNTYRDFGETVSDDLGSEFDSSKHR